MTEYPDRLTELIYKASGLKLTTAQRIAREIADAGYLLPAGKAPLLTDEQINAAFDGDFAPVTFDHKPTADEIMLIKLRLVAESQRDAAHKFYTGKEAKENDRDKEKG